jgi:hypothetical protein
MYIVYWQKLKGGVISWMNGINMSGSDVLNMKVKFSVS